MHILVCKCVIEYALIRLFLFASKHFSGVLQSLVDLGVVWKNRNTARKILFLLARLSGKLVIAVIVSQFERHDVTVFCCYFGKSILWKVNCGRLVSSKNRMVLIWSKPLLQFKVDLLLQKSTYFASFHNVNMIAWVPLALQEGHQQIFKITACVADDVVLQTFIVFILIFVFDRSQFTWCS